MSFQFHAVPAQKFSDLFDMTDDELHQRNARRMIATQSPGFPCRVSMMDARVGETVILVNYEHHAKDSPFRASHAIFVRQDAEPARIKPNEVPPLLESRLLSVRGFDADDDMIDADVVDGTGVSGLIEQLFENPLIRYLHVHNAKLGCFAATVTRQA